MKYKVDINGQNELFGITDDMIEAGTRVEFLLPTMTDKNYVVASAEVIIGIDGSYNPGGQTKYFFVMPESDVKVTINTTGGMMNNGPAMGMGMMMGAGMPDMSMLMGMSMMNGMQQTAPSEGEAPAAHRFCPECGAKAMTATSKFCIECGAPLK